MACSADATPYAELHCLSNFTFLRGASHPQELVEQAAQLGYGAIALTDECSLAGVVRAHDAAKACGIKLIIGSELQLDDGPKLLLLATNREGYAQLSERITIGRRRADKGQYSLLRSDFETAMPDCLALLIPPANEAVDKAWTTRLTENIDWLKARFPDRSWLAAQRLFLPHEDQRIDAIQRLSVDHSIPVVACGDVHMHRRNRRALQDMMTAIRINRPLKQAGYALYPNGERHLRPYATLAELYPRRWLDASLDIARRCQFSLAELRYEYPEDLVPEGMTAGEYLRQLTEEGIRHYWPEGESDKVRQQIEHELTLISELKYEHFFLTVHDIVKFARSQNILCQGRGSAANSAVCFCLHITAVDPSRSNMLFERFISRERNEPPDIDVDFDNGRREEVMQYIYRKYGRHRAALAATLITYRRKSALRDAGKALGLNLEQINRLTGTLVWWQDGIADEHLREAGFDPDNPLICRLIMLVNQLHGFPRHLSQHVGGFVIARDRLSRMVPTENAAMADRTIIQWDKRDLESLGLLKVDCLALGMLNAINRCFQLLQKHRGLSLTLDNIPPKDPATYRMIQKADTVGVFQIESRAQMNMLPRLKPATFYDLVIQIAIVRPGPIQGDMVHPYLRRRDGKEPVTYPSEEVKSVLKRTLGVPIFQEQVIELAMVAAGFSGGEADQLRRAIGAWRSTQQLETFRQRLITGMRQRGYQDAFAEQIFHQIKGFGEYGFPESHSASFALLAYVSSWLKRHHLAAFTCALLNSQPMGFYAPAQLIQDTKRHRVEVRPIDVCRSDWESTLEETPEDKFAVRLGLHLVKGLNRDTAVRLVNERLQAPYDDLPQLQHRCRLNKKDSDALAAADAFHSLAGHRHQARWLALGVDTQPGLFDGLTQEEDVVDLPTPREGEEIMADYAHTGVSLRRHPLSLLRPRFTKQGWHSSADLQRCKHKTLTRVIGLVTNRQHPGSANGTIFLTLEDEFGNSNIVVWPRVSERFTKEVVHGRLLLIQGHVEREGMVIHVIANEVVDYTEWLGRLPTVSRDFH